MLRILGSPKTLCDGLTRRDFLHVGGLGALGLGLGDALLPGKRKAEGGAPHLRQGEGVHPALPLRLAAAARDVRPQARRARRDPGRDEGRSPTACPALRICEGLPRIAQVMDRVTVVRSMTHPYPVHGVAYAVSGIPTYTPALETEPRDAAALAVHRLRRRLPAKRGAPAARRRRCRATSACPGCSNSKTDMPRQRRPVRRVPGPGATTRSGPTSTARARELAPSYTDGADEGLPRPVRRHARRRAASGSRRRASCPTTCPSSGSTAGGRCCDQFDRARRRSTRPRTAGRSTSSSDDGLLAADLRHDARGARHRPRAAGASASSYGMTLFGQACLAARRLVEAGCKFVTVFWDGFGQFAGCAWDTHANHYPRLKEYLLPGFDLAYSALIRDLEARGLLDETLVLWMSEHGRTPQIDPKPKGGGPASLVAGLLGGRWPAAASRAGKVVGSTDKHRRRRPATRPSRRRTCWRRRSTCSASTRTRPCPTASAGRCRSRGMGSCGPSCWGKTGLSNLRWTGLARARGWRREEPGRCGGTRPS